MERVLPPAVQFTLTASEADALRGVASPAKLVPKLCWLQIVLSACIFSLSGGLRLDVLPLLPAAHAMPDSRDLVMMALMGIVVSSNAFMLVSMHRLLPPHDGEARVRVMRRRRRAARWEDSGIARRA